MKSYGYSWWSRIVLYLSTYTMEELFIHSDAAIYDADISAFDIWDTQVTADLIPDLKKTDFKWINQRLQALTLMSCTIAGAVNQVYRLWYMLPTNDDLIRYVEYSRDKYWYKPWHWWLTRSWVNSTRSLWNVENKDKQVFTQSGIIGDNIFYAALRKWHLVGVTYRGNADYNKDFSSDGVLNGTKFDNPTYGHRMNVFGAMLEYISDDEIWARDNYDGLIKHNKYKITDLIALVKNGVFYPQYHIFLPVSILTETPEAIVKKKMERLALDHLLYAMSSTFDSINNSEVHTALSTCAKVIRKYTWENKDESPQATKAVKSMINALSFGWNFVKDTTMQWSIWRFADALRKL